MTTREDIKILRRKIFGTIAGFAATVAFSDKAAAQQVTDSNEGFRAVSENVIQSSKPAYLDYNLSFAERKASLDEAVEQGNIKLTKNVIKKNDINPLVYSYIDGEGKLVARACFGMDVYGQKVTGAGSFQFFSESAMAYTIEQDGFHIEVSEGEGRPDAARRDWYKVEGSDIDKIEKAQLYNVWLTTGERQVEMYYSDKGLEKTDVRMGAMHQTFHFKERKLGTETSTQEIANTLSIPTSALKDLKVRD